MLTTDELVMICNDMVDEIFTKGRTFYNKPLSSTLRPLVEVVVTERGAKVEVPFWFPVQQYGRGIRKSNVYQGFDIAIYNWMKKRNMFKSKTTEGQIREAKSVAWYINKYGNKHYRSGRYIDIYDTIVKETTEKVVEMYGNYALKISSEMVAL